MIDTKKFHYTVQRLRSFCIERGFLEVHTQSNLSILAACEDPTTIATFNYSGNLWPMPQTGQMWLEYELLKNGYPGVFCVSTSFRNEPNPIPGRHDLIFPMFEFEFKGDMVDLVDFERDLLSWLGFDRGSFQRDTYRKVCHCLDVTEIDDRAEQNIWDKYGPVFFLTDFPVWTSPFWNMKRHFLGQTANKVDVILYGVETIGSAERSTDIEEMRESFHSISGGKYADTLYAQFGRERVEAELEEFLSFEMVPRVGGGIGMTRMIRAVEMLNDVEIGDD